MAKPLEIVAARRRRDESERARRSGALIGAATRVFAEKGFDAATTREVAADAGCSEGVIHRYFGSKAGLLDAVLREVAESLAGSFAPGAHESLEDALRHAIITAMQTVEGQRDGVRLLLLRALLDPGAARLLYDLRERYVSQLVAVIGPDAASRSFLDLARVTADLVLGLTLLRIVDGGRTDEGAATRAARILTATV